MATDNINVAWVEAAKEITVAVIKSPYIQNADEAAKIYKTVYKAVREASAEEVKSPGLRVYRAKSL